MCGKAGLAEIRHRIRRRRVGTYVADFGGVEGGQGLRDLLPCHPPRLHEQQVQVLQQLPESERAEQAQLLRGGNAAYRYHQGLG